MLTLALLVARYCAAPPAQVRVNGQAARVIDGDSFRSADQDMRIDGIDAPEYRQNCQNAAGRDWPCGKAARAALSQLLLSSSWTCMVRARDDYGRAVVRCTDDRAQDLGSMMVAKGMAISGEQWGIAAYSDAEEAAKAQRRGIWQGAFLRPSDWRAANPRSVDGGLAK